AEPNSANVHRTFVPIRTSGVNLCRRAGQFHVDICPRDPEASRSLDLRSQPQCGAKACRQGPPVTPTGSRAASTALPGVASRDSTVLVGESPLRALSQR